MLGDMAEFPYIIAPNVLKRFIQEIPDTNQPDKLTVTELRARGYKSGNYNPIIPILKFIKFVSDSGVPTENWTNYRSKTAGPSVMAACVRDAYKDLFKIYPNAQEKDTEALRNFFSTRVKKSENVQNWTVATFKALCDLSDFKSPKVIAGHEADEGDQGGDGEKKMRIPLPAAPSGLVVNLNIQLVLPPTENAEIYEKFFAAMKKHLLDSEKT